jgi:hypothetical protein
MSATQTQIYLPIASKDTAYLQIFPKVLYLCSFLTIYEKQAHKLSETYSLHQLSSFSHSQNMLAFKWVSSELALILLSMASQSATKYLVQTPGQF